jgi:hypothetical protein
LSEEPTGTIFMYYMTYTIQDKNKPLAPAVGLQYFIIKSLFLFIFHQGFE